MPAPGAGYSVVWGGVALTAATAKTVGAILAGSSKPPTITEITVSSDGTSGNLLVELIFGDNTTAGTSTSFTPLQIRGQSETALATAAITYTAEPTTLTVVKKLARLPMPTGPLIIQYPLGREPTGVIAASTSGKLIGIRCTASVGCNVDGHIEFEE